MEALPSHLWDPEVRGSSPRRPTHRRHRDGSGVRVMEKLVIQKTLRVPASTGPRGDASAVARQPDAALLDVGFSASSAVLEHVGSLAHGAAMDLAATVVSAVRE